LRGNKQPSVVGSLVGAVTVTTALSLASLLSCST
jgi:hypothetical protein